MMPPVSRALVIVDTAILSTDRFSDFNLSPVSWACLRPLIKCNTDSYDLTAQAVYGYWWHGMGLPKAVRTLSSGLLASSTYWPCLIRIKFLTAVGLSLRLLTSDPSLESCSCAGVCFLLQKARMYVENKWSTTISAYENVDLNSSAVDGLLPTYPSYHPTALMVQQLNVDE